MNIFETVNARIGWTKASSFEQGNNNGSLKNVDGSGSYEFSYYLHLEEWENAVSSLVAVSDFFIQKRDQKVLKERYETFNERRSFIYSMRSGGCVSSYDECCRLQQLYIKLERGFPVLKGSD